MGMVMIVAAEGDGEADSSTPLGPGLLTPTSGPYESQQVVSSSYMDYMLLSTHPSHSSLFLFLGFFFFFGLLYGHSSLNLGPILIQDDFTSKSYLNYICKDPYSNKITGLRFSLVVSFRATIQSTTVMCYSLLLFLISMIVLFLHYQLVISRRENSMLLKNL